MPTLEAVVSWLEHSAGQDAVLCGAYRRGGKEIQHTDVIIEGPLAKALESVEAMCKLSSIEYDLLDGRLANATLLVNRIQVTLHVVGPESWGGAILYYTGNLLFRISMAAEAKRQGYKLNAKGLWYRGELTAGRSEAQIFDVLDLVFIQPKSRNFRREKGGLACRKLLERSG